MSTVIVRVSSGDLRDQMIAMRVWLDDRRYEPASFVYDQAYEGVLVQVGFRKAAEAAAFAARFSGRLGPDS